MSVFVFREVTHQGSCCQKTTSSSTQQLHFSGCPNPRAHPTQANSHHGRPSCLLLSGFFSSVILRLTASVSGSSSTPSLSSLCFSPAMFLRWFSCLKAQGSGIALLFCWDILMRFNIFYIFLSLCHPLIFISVYFASFLFSCCMWISVFPHSLRLPNSLGSLSLSLSQASPSVFIH